MAAATTIVPAERLLGFRDDDFLAMNPQLQNLDEVLVDGVF